IGVDVHHMPEVFDIARVAPFHQWRKIIVDRLGYQRSALGKCGAAKPIQPCLIGLHLHHDQRNPVGRGEDRANFRDFHSIHPLQSSTDYTDCTDYIYIYLPNLWIYRLAPDETLVLKTPRAEVSQDAAVKSRRLKIVEKLCFLAACQHFECLDLEDYAVKDDE